MTTNPSNTVDPGGSVAVAEAPEAKTVSSRPPSIARLQVSEAWRHGVTKVGVVFTGLIVLLALFGPMFAPHPAGAFVGPPFALPGGEAVLGTDYLGRDVLSAILRGGASIVWMSFAATSLGVAAGVLFGLWAAYSRRLVDSAIMRALDVAYAFPYIILVLLFVSMLGRHLWLIVLLVGWSYIPGIARQTRGIAKEALTREYVQAAEVVGASRRFILTAEVLPNLMTTLLVEYSQRLTWSVGLMASISFLGFGAQPPATDWGLMINQNRNGLILQPWGVLGPIILLAIFTIGTNLLAEGISRTMAGIDRAVLVG